MNILLVEDDERIVEFLRRGLSSKGFVVDVARTGTEGLEIGRLRVKVDESRDKSIIKTIRGRGYRMLTNEA